MCIVVYGPVINKTNVSLNFFSDLFSQFKYLHDRIKFVATEYSRAS